MKNIKVAGKLLISFGVVLGLMFGIIVFAILSMNRVQDTFQSFYEKEYANTKEFDSIELNLNEATRYLLAGQILSDDTLIAARLDSAKESLAKIDASFEFLHENYTGSASTMEKIQQEIEDFRVVYREMAVMVQEHRDDEAAAFFEETFITAFAEVNAATIEAMDHVAEKAVIAYETATSTIQTTTIFMIILGIVAVILGLIFAFYIIKSFTGALKDIEMGATELANGNFEAVVTYESKDEFGHLANVFRTIFGALRGVIKDIDMMLTEASQGNFRVASSDENLYLGDLRHILESMKLFISNMNETMTKINTASEQVAAGSDQVSSGAQALSQGAMEQASSVEELAATITAISSKITANADDAALASDKTSVAGSEMKNAAAKMDQLVSAMNEIQNSSGETKKIIKTIEDIAFQTNILALNAAVEAARAGAAGKGFAVVADEVRNLAGKSAEAAKNTTDLIEGTVNAIDKGNVLVEEVAKEIGLVSKATMEVAEISEKISGAAKEAADSITQVTVGIDQISGVVQTNSATSEESAAASQELSGQAQMLKDLVEEFKLAEVD